METTGELIKLIEGIFRDEILWVIGFNNINWFETTLVKDIADIETKSGITYNIISWSGKSERIFKVD
ncbi:MAG: hypothetical protein H7Y86_13150 [Rhizobacter sp.]|nr:hypothetical protein [Ferruginibacter sp.]